MASIWLRAVGVVMAEMLAGPVVAAPDPNKIYIPPDAAGEVDAAGTALVDAFSRFCLDRFPPRGRVEDAAGPGKVTAMTAEGVRGYLHDDPGRGWFYDADGGRYILTMEDPPYHTCAVRRSYPVPPHYRLPWLMITSLWAAGKDQGPLVEGPKQTVRRDGLLIELASHAMAQGRGDVFMEIKTTYPDGHIEERLARRAIGQ